MSTTQDIANIKAVFGNRVRTLRRASGATQQTVADNCGIYRTYLSRVESGAANPSLKVLADVAAWFGVPVGSLLTEPDDAPLPAEALTALYASPLPREAAACPPSCAGS